jgi:hypothetical protein
LKTDNSAFALAKAMHVIAALWQSGGPAYRAIAVLQRQPGFWAVVIGIIDNAGATDHNNNKSLLNSFLNEENGSDGVDTNAAAGSGMAAAEKWIGMKKECWKVAAETAAMHVLAAECFLWRNNHITTPINASSSSMSSHTMPSELHELIVQGKLQVLVPRLLERYCLVLPNVAELENDAARLATATAAQMLEISVHDHALWASIQAGPCLVSKLASIAEPELKSCSSKDQVASALHSIAAAALGAAGDQAVQSRPALRALADCLLTQAEIPHRMAPIAHYGSNYFYDSSLLGRRVGAALAQEAPLLSDLKTILGAVSVAYSLEDARADAAGALDALVAVADAAASSVVSSKQAHKKSTKENEEKKGDTVQHTVKVLSKVIKTVVSATAQGAKRSDNAGSRNGENSSLLKSLHLASAAAAAQVTLVILRSQSYINSSTRSTRTTASPFAAGATIAPVVVENILSLAATWFETSDMLLMVSTSNSNSSSSMNEMNERELVDAISKCVLAAALHAASSSSSSSLPSAAALGETPEQYAAQRLLPALLTIISGSASNASKSNNQHAEAAASLCAALLDRLVPSDVWLPVISHHLHFGQAIGTALEAMNHAASISSNSTIKDKEKEEQVNKHGAILEALLLLALQVTQSPAGAMLLIEQGVPPLLLSLAAWLQAPPPGGNLLGMATTPLNLNTHTMAELRMTPSTAVSMFSINPVSSSTPPSHHLSIDYSNAYSIIDGSFSTKLPHRLWCAVLSLMGLLTATAPGVPAVVFTALQLLVVMDPRIQLAIEPPEGNTRQPVTLAMAQESRYALFLLYGVVNVAGGQYRLALPHALPALRRASASLLRFLAGMEPGGGASSSSDLVCVAVTEDEKNMIKTAAPSTALSSGWFGVEACCTTTTGGNINTTTTTQLQSLEGVGLLNGFTWELAEQLYSCAQYALAFQLAVAPEVSEAEAENLGPEWPDASTLSTLCERCIEIIDPACAGNAAAHPAVRRNLKLMISIMKLSLQLLDLMVPKGEAAAKMVRGLMRESEAAVERAQAILATYEL